MTNAWFLVTVTGVLIVLIALFLTPTPLGVPYLIGGGLAMSGPTVALLRAMDRRNRRG